MLKITLFKPLSVAVLTLSVLHGDNTRTGAEDGR